MMEKFFKIFLISTALASCSIYSSPEVPESKFKSWEETVANEKAKLDQKWWKNFDDEHLNQIIETARENNKDLKIIKAKINQARASEQAVLAENLPLINANADATRNKNSTTLSDRPILRKFSNNYKANFDASWEVDIFGIVPSIRASKQWSEKNIEDYNSALVTLYGDVATSYFNIRKLQAQEETIKNKKSEILEKLRLQKLLFQAGKIDNLEITKTENELSGAESQQEIVSNNIKQEIFKLEVLAGLDPNSLKKIFAENYSVKIPSNEIIASAPSEVLAQRPDVRVAEKNYLYNTSLQDVAVSQLFPKISIAGLLGFESGRDSLLFNSRSEVFRLAGGITTPIFDWKRIRADIKEADAKTEEALANYEKSVITALSDVESSFAGYKSAKDNFDIINKGLGATENEVSLNNERYNKGLSSYIDVLNSKIKLQEDKFKISDAKFENLIQMVRVYKSLGGGWE